MFPKFFLGLSVVFMFSAQALAHTVISPALGVSGTPKRSDAQRARNAAPCGKTGVAANIDSSTPVVAAADGSFTVTATNFNRGRDGSRQVTMTVDPTGTGDNFVSGTVNTNGALAPKTTGSEQITAALPAGTKCTGGAAGNLCLASFTTAGRFGNCVVVQQGAAGAADPTAANGNNGTSTDTGTAGTTGNTGNGGAAAKTGAPTGTANKGAGAAGAGNTGKQSSNKNAFSGAVGTRAARALHARTQEDVEDDHEDSEISRRGLFSWIWA